VNTSRPCYLPEAREGKLGTKFNCRRLRSIIIIIIIIIITVLFYH